MKSPKFSLVNRFKEVYKGSEYDTSLLHTLLTKGKKWNYGAMLQLLGSLMSRGDVDYIFGDKMLVDIFSDKSSGVGRMVGRERPEFVAFLLVVMFSSGRKDTRCLVFLSLIHI